MTGKEENHLPYDLENMTIPELEALLQQDFIAQDDGSASDVDFVMAVMEVIQKKEEARPDYQPLDTAEAWEEFQSFYNTEEGRENSIYRHVEEDGGGEAEAEAEPEAPVQQPKKAKSMRTRCLIAALIAALVAVTTIPISGYANVIQMVIALWNDSHFAYSSDDRSTVDGSNKPLVIPDGFGELWDTINRNELEGILIPQYIPDGFKVSDSNLYVYPLSDNIEFHIIYTKDNDYIGIDIIKNNKTPKTIYEKDTFNATAYKLKGTEYYIFSNNNERVSTIYYNDVEYSFGTTLSELELKNIIDSMCEE
ncbi:MAG: DUF4367 domain-containing protein [Lawsonibacter sp.]|nr:DUF4367 domain-containing protein [Lawsonibacter sp.]